MTHDCEVFAETGDCPHMGIPRFLMSVIEHRRRTEIAVMEVWKVLTEAYRMANKAASASDYGLAK